MPSKSIISISDVTKHFGAAVALNRISLSFEAGEMVALIGASGSGKSTLLRILAGFIEADKGSGQVMVAGQVVQDNGCLSPRVRHARAQIAFVFQQFNLVGRLSVLTNVLIGSLSGLSHWRTVLGLFPLQAKVRAARALEQVGIIDHIYKRAADLSGGQQQRVAIARAMIQGAQVVLADEPIASLDPESSRNVMEMLALLNREYQRTVLVSLHQVEFARRFCQRTIALRQGEVVYDGPSSALTGAMLAALYGGNAAELGLDFEDEQQSPFIATEPVLALAAAAAAPPDERYARRQLERAAAVVAD
jgi:phosphonate transport system ATP-binding protein